MRSYWTCHSEQWLYREPINQPTEPQISTTILKYYTWRNDWSISSSSLLSESKISNKYFDHKSQVRYRNVSNVDLCKGNHYCYDNGPTITKPYKNQFDTKIQSGNFVKLPRPLGPVAGDAFYIFIGECIAKSPGQSPSWMQTIFADLPGKLPWWLSWALHSPVSVLGLATARRSISPRRTMEAIYVNFERHNCTD